MEKPAQTQYPVLDLIQRRWSPRAFADRPIEPQKIKRLFEAARWAASSYNEQPWRFLVATREQPEAFEKLLSCLVEKNQHWAKGAPLLMITCSKKHFSWNNKPNRVHIHDIGLAMGNFTLQALAMDLWVHQMAGVDLEKVVESYDVPEEFEPVAGCAVGYMGQPGALPEEWMRKGETAERTRKPLSELVFTGEFGKSSPLLAEG